MGRRQRQTSAGLRPSVAQLAEADGGTIDQISEW